MKLKKFRISRAKGAVFLYAALAITAAAFSVGCAPTPAANSNLGGVVLSLALN